MRKIIKNKNLVPVTIADLNLDDSPDLNSTDPVTSRGIASAITEAVGSASDALQEQIDDIAEKAGSGYTPKGEASVATLNELSGQENGWLYTMTDAGTLTDGSLAVVAGDTVAWDATNEAWYKAMDYAPRQYGTNEVHNLPTTITAFRTGDYIAVDGTNGTAKMSKDDLLRETAENALGGIHSLSDTATEADLVSGNYLALDGSAWTKKLPAEDVAKRSVQDGLVSDVDVLKVTSVYDIESSAIKYQVNQVYLRPNGEFSTNNYHKCYYREVFAGEAYRVKGNSTYDYVRVGFSSAIPEDGGSCTILKDVRNSNIDGAFVIVSDGYLVIGCTLSDTGIDLFSLTSSKAYTDKEIADTKSYVDNKIELNNEYIVDGFVREVYNDYDQLMALADHAYISANGTYTANSNFNLTDYIDITGDDFVRVIASVSASVSPVTFYDENKDLLLAQAGENPASISEYEIVIPSGAKYCRCCFWNKDSHPSGDDVTKQMLLVGKNISLSLYQQLKKFKGKKLGVIGDSISAGQYSTKSYSQIISETLGMELYNVAVPGTTLNQIYSSISNLPASLDVIFVMGGTNNYKSTTTQGNIGDLLVTENGKKVPNTDETMAGRLNLICETLQTSYPQALVILITPPKSTRGYDNSDGPIPWNFLDLENLYKQVSCVNSCVNFNLSAECPINSQNEEQAKIYYEHIWESGDLQGQRDLTHPTIKGHEKMAEYIMGKMLSCSFM